MTPDDFAAILAARTPGRWHADEGFGGKWVVTGGPADFAVHPAAADQPYAVLAQHGAYDDAEAVVAAVNLAPLLLDLWRAAQAWDEAGSNDEREKDAILDALQLHPRQGDRIRPDRRAQGEGAGDGAAARRLRQQVAPRLVHPVEDVELVEGLDAE